MTEEKTTETQPQAINILNLAPNVDKEELRKIGEKVCEEFDIDVQSRQDYDERRKKWLKLFSGQRDPKSFPWSGASNTHIPLLGMACLQFQSRAYEALVPPKEVVKALATDGVSSHAAKRVGKHMDYQILRGMEEWVEEMDRALMLMPMMGSAYKKTYYDDINRRPASVCLSVDEFVTPYRCKRLENSPRNTHIIYMSINDIQIRQNSGIFINAEDLTEGLSIEQASPTPMYTEQANKNEGQQEPTLDYIGTRPILEQHRYLDLNFNILTGQFEAKNNIQKPYIVTVDKETKKVLRIQPLEYYDEVREKVMVWQAFTQYTFIPNPDSHYSFGFGHFIDHMNETANTLLNQLTDAGTLSNVRGGFVAKRSGVKKGQLSFAMGEFKEVDVLADDIGKAIFQIDFKPPSSVLFTLLGMISDWVKNLTSVADWMAGKLPPSDTAATTMLAVIEQGLKVFSVIQKRCHASFAKELKKIFLLNRFYLDEKEYFLVQDTKSEEYQSMSVGKADYMNDIDVVPASDPNITSRAEQLIKSQQVLAEVKSNPLTAEDPEALYYATRNYLKTLEAPDIDVWLKKPAPPEPPNLTPQEENAGFLQEKPGFVIAQQNHDDHMREHMMFRDSVWGQNLTPQGKNMLEAHVQEHMAYSYMQSELPRMEKMAAQPTPQLGEVEDIEPGQDNAGGMEGMDEPDVNELLYQNINKMAAGIQGGLA